LMNTYATSLYGSNTWDIFSPECERLYTSYNVTIRNVLNIDRCTHRYMIEPLSECLHLKTMISSMYATFHRSLVTSKKLPVRFLARLVEKDNRTVLVDEDLSRLSSSLIKKQMKYRDAPIGEE
jgi:hypothetical protein